MRTIQWLLFACVFCMRLFGQSGDTIKVLSIAQPLVVDGKLDDWSEKYFAGQFTKAQNIIYMNRSGDWDGFNKDYQARIYLTHDSSFLYIGWQTLVDDASLRGRGWDVVCGDNMKLCFGGMNDIVYIWNDTIQDGVNPECFNYPYRIQAAVGKVKGLPVYEVRIPLSEIKLYYPGHPAHAFMNIMTEDYDDKCKDAVFLGLGFNFPDSLSKQNSNDNQWENPVYFPVLLFVD